MTLHAFVHEHYPAGLGASYATVERLISGRADVLAVWTEVTKRKPGNPNRDSETGRLIPSLYNIQDRTEAPTGTSREAGLRKLQKAATEGNEIAQSALTDAVEGRKSVHAACVDAGFWVDRHRVRLNRPHHVAEALRAGHRLPPETTRFAAAFLEAGLARAA